MWLKDGKHLKPSSDAVQTKRGFWKKDDTKYIVKRENQWEKSGQQKLKERVYENIAWHKSQSASSEVHVFMNYIRHCQLLLFLRHSISHIMLDTVIQNDMTWCIGIHGTSTGKFRNSIWAFSTCLNHQTPKQDCQSLLKVGPKSLAIKNAGNLDWLCIVTATWGKLHIMSLNSAFLLQKWWL